MMFEAHIPSATRTPAKERIYIAAASLFHNKGYPATSMRDLANAVGLLPSSLYSHINSKQEVLCDICFECGQKFIEAIAGITGSENTADEKLRDLVALHVKMAREDQTSMTVFNDEWRHIKQPELERFIAMRRDYEAACRSIINEGIEQGLFRENAGEMALHIVLSSGSWIRQRRFFGEMTTSTLTDTLYDIIMNGLKN